MKQFIVCIIIIGLFIGPTHAGTNLPSAVTHQKVYELKGVSRQNIYIKSREWIARNFKSSKAVIEYENKEEGIIIGNGIVPHPESYSFWYGGAKYKNVKIKFTMKEDIKDNRIRITYENIYIVLPPSYRGYKGSMDPELIVGKSEIADSYMEDIKTTLLSLSDDLAAYIITRGPDDNW